MIAYEIFRSLGLEVDVRPVLEFPIDSDGEYNPHGKAYYYFGPKFTQPVGINGEFEDVDSIEDVYKAYTKDFRKVAWMNKPLGQTRSVQLAYTAVSLSSNFESLLANEMTN